MVGHFWNHRLVFIFHTVGRTMIIRPDFQTWRSRAVLATDANKTLLGCFVLAILGWQHTFKPPRFGSRAVIDKDGIVISHMQNQYGEIHRNQRIGPVQDIIDNFRGLADHLKLSDVDRDEMFGELRKWFLHDARANSTNQERGLLQ